jgi:hypothetical protein
MSEMSPQRKKVVVMAASVASMSGGAVLLKEYPHALIAWIVFMLVMLVLTIVEVAKLKGQEL